MELLDRCDCGRRIVTNCGCNLRPAFRCEQGHTGYGGLLPHHHQEDTA